MFVKMCLELLFAAATSSWDKEIHLIRNVHRHWVEMCYDVLSIDVLPIAVCHMEERLPSSKRLSRLQSVNELKVLDHIQRTLVFHRSGLCQWRDGTRKEGALLAFRVLVVGEKCVCQST